MKGAALTQWLGAVHKQSPEVNAAGFLIVYKREHSKKKKNPEGRHCSFIPLRGGS